MTPLEVVILMHYHYATTRFSNDGHPDAPAVKRFKEHLCSLGAMRPIDPDFAFGADYELTEMGKIWVQKICDTPQPVKRIIWE